mmetsp:Transcript_17248/g.34472  ORF Transcript_17248/g.34472 Transcript_17248/m.34472 type:complete len:275 (-) Transcript_17248:42-866(-)
MGQHSRIPASVVRNNLRQQEEETSGMSKVISKARRVAEAVTTGVAELKQLTPSMEAFGLSKKDVNPDDVLIEPATLSMKRKGCAAVAHKAYLFLRYFLLFLMFVLQAWSAVDVSAISFGSQINESNNVLASNGILAYFLSINGVNTTQLTNPYLIIQDPTPWEEKSPLEQGLSFIPLFNNVLTAICVGLIITNQVVTGVKRRKNNNQRKQVAAQQWAAADEEEGRTGEGREEEMASADAAHLKSFRPRSSSREPLRLDNGSAASSGIPKVTGRV